MNTVGLCIMYKVIKEKSRGGRFLWAGLLKKNIRADYEQLLRPVFSSFRGQINK